MHKLIEDDVVDILSKVDLSPLIGKTILITGASGLIGTYFVACLKSLNAIVYTTSLSTPIDELYVNHNICDLTEDLPWWETEFDVIIHCAGYGQPGKFITDPVTTLMLNTTVVEWLMHYLKPQGKFLFLSTSEIYSGLNGQCSEEDVGTTTPYHPRACYIEGKRCGETFVNSYRALGYDAKSARVALAYGPGTRKNDSRVLNEFIYRALHDDKLIVKGDGSALRTYCYISDTIEMLWNILLYGKQPVYNVGGRSSISINNLADLIAGLIGIPVSFSNRRSQSDSSPQIVSLDMKRYLKEFGLKQYVSLTKGLERTLVYQRWLYEK